MGFPPKKVSAYCRDLLSDDIEVGYGRKCGGNGGFCNEMVRERCPGTEEAFAASIDSWNANSCIDAKLLTSDSP
ncbi:hypothetical protein RHSIM_Rhsim11G0102100 [Rhododendron simsii]|uniref:Uncharacterized protein n=1 Tax=Rhododendron simsii TaxID=118357 RepID=A0A834LAV6_RHOSS|nr:hypothetical protein RHSIM_Rhsim11G0102100 [Rhododendron simsii]